MYALVLLAAASSSAAPDVNDREDPAASRGARGLIIVDEQGRDVAMYEESHALIIGASHYTRGWPNLPGVLNDVAAVKAALEGHGFHTVIVIDPDQETLERSIRDFINQYGLQPANRLIFFFAGHGSTVKQAYGGEMGYIVPSDAPNPNRDLDGFLRRAMDMQQFEVFARKIQSRHALFLFDACFSGSIFALSRAVPENITYKTASPVRQFITSGSADEQVPDESIFSRQLIAALDGEGDRNQDGYVTGIELGEFLQERVVNYSRNAQHPQYGKIRDPNLDRGDFVFVLPGPRGPALDGSGFSLRNLEMEATRLKWQERLVRMEQAFSAAETYGHQDVPAALKARAWMLFQHEFAENDPFSERDDTMRTLATHQMDALALHGRDQAERCEAESAAGWQVGGARPGVPGAYAPGADLSAAQPVSAGSVPERPAPSAKGIWESSWQTVPALETEGPSNDIRAQPEPAAQAASSTGTAAVGENAPVAGAGAGRETAAQAPSTSRRPGGVLELYLAAAYGATGIDGASQLAFDAAGDAAGAFRWAVRSTGTDLRAGISAGIRAWKGLEVGLEAGVMHGNEWLSWSTYYENSPSTELISTNDLIHVLAVAKLRWRFVTAGVIQPYAALGLGVWFSASLEDANALFSLHEPFGPYWRGAIEPAIGSRIILQRRTFLSVELQGLFDPAGPYLGRQTDDAGIIPASQLEPIPEPSPALVSLRLGLGLTW